MLIIVPSSEGKRVPAATGQPLDLTTLGFPSLTPVREQLLDALAATSSTPDADRRLGVAASIAAEVEQNRALRTLPTAPALEVYTGVLHAALAAGSLDRAARRRASRSLVLASSLFGLLRPDDRIPPYRLPVGARLLDTPRLEACWRPRLAAALDAAAGTSGLVCDLRASTYQALGVVSGADERMVTFRLAAGVAGGTVVLKQLRGRIIRLLLETAVAPESPAALAELLGGHYGVELVAPARRAAPFILHVTP